MRGERLPFCLYAHQRGVISYEEACNFEETFEEAAEAVVIRALASDSPLFAYHFLHLSKYLYKA